MRTPESGRYLVGDLVTDIALELLAEEHRQGLPLGIPDHCAECTAEQRRQLQASCPHENTQEYTMYSFGGEHIRTHEVCSDCDLERITMVMTKVLG